ncbi:hypothetical protein ACTXT7_003559, partial [Hymenolepis weldensis]
SDPDWHFYGLSLKLPQRDIHSTLVTARKAVIPILSKLFSVIGELEITAKAHFAKSLSQLSN